MTTLFRRAVRIAAAPRTPGASGTALAAIEQSLGVDLSNVDCAFRIKKSLKPEPNSCDLRVYNLAESTRNVLQTPKRIMLRVEAGYENALSQLFLGEVRSAHSFREGSEVVTEISTGDSDKELQTARVSFSVGPDTPVSVVLTNIARALEVGPGNVEEIGAVLAAAGFHFSDGTAIFGNAALALTWFCLSFGLEWSIQDGQLQILMQGDARSTKGVVLSADTGLIGSPTIDHKGVVTASALIQPDVAPGRYVQIKSLAFSGTFRVIECEYVGDTRGNDWFVRFTGKKPKVPTP